MKTRTSLVAGLAVATSLVAGGADAAARIKIGVLECKVVEATGFVVGSTRQIDCVFDPVGGRPSEHYIGEISRLGIDIGSVKQVRIVWGVLAPTNQRRPGALEGTYVGVSAEATVGVGVGANALIGGFDRSIALNPLSVQSQRKGVDIALGVAGLTLKSVK